MLKPTKRFHKSGSKHNQVLQSSFSPPLLSEVSGFPSSYLPVDLSGSQDLGVGSPGPGAGSPAGSAAACARLASYLLVRGTTPPGNG